MGEVIGEGYPRGGGVFGAGGCRGRAGDGGMAGVTDSVSMARWGVPSLIWEVVHGDQGHSG
jgi:hypothetical protein